MRVCSTIRAFLLGCFCLLTVVSASGPAERILEYHSDITLEDDGSLLVTETITVNSTGQQIRHGIFRDFPTRYSDPFNNRYVVGFQMLSATCDSAPEQFRLEEHFNGQRVYLGSPKALVSPGRHVYTISYTTNRQLGFFKDRDELFWNVTGNGWEFPIDAASATVHLPLNIPADKVALSGFTGRQGSHESRLASSSDEAGFEFTAQRPLVWHEGLSVLLRWPKGYITPPTFSQNLEFFFRDNRGALLLASGFLVTLLYYLIAWSAVGRDPVRGVITALYEPPANLSPSAMRYLMRMGYDNKTFAAAILDMAVRGFLKITEDSGAYTLTLTGKDDRVLTPDEKQIASELFEGRNELLLRQENHTGIKSAMAATQKWLKAAEEKTYFLTNSRYLIPAIALTVLTMASYFLTLGMPQRIGAVIIILWLTLWTIGVSALFLHVFAAWRDVARHGSASLVGAGKAFLYTLWAIPFLGGEVLGILFLSTATSLSFAVFLVATGILHGIFVHLMKAPTFAGRRLMDQVEGFKMFLGSVDGDRLNRAAPPQQTPEVFEKFLPYALALDVEQDWANKFSGVLSAAGTATGSSGSAYTPSFYSGSSWSSFSGAGFASSFGSSLTSAISSSSAAPGSGAGGGGGGSGGGGGGGGGGGW
ncbi:MAG TPA: DUF2207 domain-containing protein [Candidatus Sulfotelmatobacter sp.]|jgi:hypothetical protein|nr:DUF2207 domain-containing protein [Candidatus Sulfotelmatobacter sp.]